MKKSFEAGFKFFLFSVLAILSLGVTLSGAAETRLKDDRPKVDEKKNPAYNIFLDKPTIEAGYTVNTFNEELKLSLTPGILNDSTYVTAQEVDHLKDPWNLERVSKVYEFEFLNKDAYSHKNPFYIQFSYDGNPDHYKKVFFYDKGRDQWIPLPTKDHPEEGFVRSLIHLPYAPIAVFSHPDLLTSGRASWYSYKGGEHAASPDFPKGSKLRVKNKDNDRFIDVEVNDHGPNRDVYPDRVVDLDKEAFSRIADSGEGVIDVTVDPLYISEEEDYLMESPANITPRVGATSGIVMLEEEEDVLWEKEADKSIPLASLTKLMAVYVFLDNFSGDLEKEVIYKREDEKRNHQYCEPWESAKVNLKEGDIVTVEDLLYSSLVGSANNTMETLVRASDMSRNEFVREMNDTAGEWGASNTHFIEPTGLAPENVTSAQDYALITNKVLSEPFIEEMSVMPDYSFTTQNTDRHFSFDNTDRLLADTKFSTINSFDITGSKTGYLHEAGYCLVVRISPYEGDDFIALTFGEDSREDSFQEMKKLIKYGLKKTRDR